MSDLAVTPAARPSLLERTDPAIILLLAWSTMAVAAIAGGHGDALGADDAMRLVGVRDLLEGQPWGDLVQHRLSPPDGVAMHWSRLVDAPLALLVAAFRPLLGQAAAESAAATVWPLALLAALAALTMKTGALLAGRAGALLSLALLTLSGPSIVHFAPGSIDHHNVQLALTLAMTLAAMRSLESWRAGALAGLFAALSLAIGLEMLPAVAIVAAAMGVALVVTGSAFSRAAAGVGRARAGTAPMVRRVTPGPDLLGPAVCDAFGAPVLVLCVLGGGALAVCAPLAARLTASARLVACMATGIGAAGMFGLAFPACLHAPYADLDPRLVALWLDKVTESQPALEALRTTPTLLAPVFAFVLLALGFGLGLVQRAPIRTRFAVLILIAVTAAHLLTGLWQIRGIIGAVVTATPLMAACLAAFLRRHSARSVGGTLLLCLCVSPAGLMSIASGVASVFPARDASLSARTAPTCSSPADLAPLAALPPGRVVAAIDLGPPILAATHHSAFAGPYHRNVAGNLAVIDAMTAPPAEAERRLAAIGADYVLACPGSLDELRYAGLAPEGLAARLARGATVPFLAPLPLEGTALKAWRVVPGGGAPSVSPAPRAASSSP